MFDSTGRMLGKTANVHFVDYRFGHAASQVTIAFPIEPIIHDNALGRSHNAIVARLKSTRECFGVGIDQTRLRLKAHALFWQVGARCLKVIQLPSSDAGNENAPDVTPTISVGIKVDNVGWLKIIDVVV